ncbi:uncharacterized protein LOC106755531 [Vigna radiata var. radiata]|uniref:Uncharacterized protein LOC106755531 n=1 Tax=Vigna radiata var. radiata TaxID=3916 RepID=A0A1S3THE1_VIGRR|nr:uncharacterized protein LOC106755531 [Vigna radiata var. radiata]
MFDGKQFDDWRIKMRFVFGFQDVLEVIEEGVPELSEKASQEERKEHKLMAKLDSKAKFLMYQCVNQKIFNKISNAETTKEAWGILMRTYGDGDRNAKELVNKMRACGDKMMEDYVDCWSGEGAKNKPQKRANLAQEEESDGEAVMLMARTEEDLSEEDVWYLDSRCSTHMRGRKDWFVGIKEVVQGKIRCADERRMNAEGSDRVVLRETGGKEVVIEEQRRKMSGCDISGLNT